MKWIIEQAEIGDTTYQFVQEGKGTPNYYYAIYRVYSSGHTELVDEFMEINPEENLRAAASRFYVVVTFARKSSLILGSSRAIAIELYDSPPPNEFLNHPF
jgi:hypothetical protein